MNKKPMIYLVLTVCAIMGMLYFLDARLNPPETAEVVPPTLAQTEGVTNQPSLSAKEEEEITSSVSNEEANNNLVAFVDSTFGTTNFDLNAAVTARYTEGEDVLYDFTTDFAYSKQEGVTSLSPYYKGEPIMSLMANKENSLFVNLYDFEAFFSLFEGASATENNPLFNAFITNNKASFTEKKSEIQSFLFDNDSRPASLVAVPSDFSSPENVPILYHLNKVASTFLKAYSTEYYRDGVLTITKENVVIGFATVAAMSVSDDVLFEANRSKTYTERELHDELFNLLFGMTPFEFLDDPKENVAYIFESLDIKMDSFSMRVVANNAENISIHLLLNTYSEETYDLQFDLSRFKGEPVVFDGQGLVSEDNGFFINKHLESYVTAYKEEDVIHAPSYAEHEIPSKQPPVLVDTHCVFDFELCLTYEKPSTTFNCLLSEGDCGGYSIHREDMRYYPLAIFDKMRSQPSTLVNETTTKEGKVIYTHRVERFVDLETGYMMSGLFSFYYDDAGHPHMSSVNIDFLYKSGGEDTFEAFSFVNELGEKFYAVNDSYYVYFGFYDGLGAFHQVSNPTLEEMNPNNLMLSEQ